MSLRVETDFPGGAAEVIRAGSDEIVFDAPRKGCPRPMWFCFRVTGPKGHHVRFTLRNAAECLGASTLGRTQPVYRGADGWRRVARNSCRYEPTTGPFMFHFRLPAETTTVASCYPYQLADLERWLARVEQPNLRPWVVAASPGGRPIYVLQVTDAHVPGRKKLIWVTARQHAGEVQGSYVLEGMVEALLGGGAAGRLLRENVFCFAPMVDVDGVESGSYGKDQPPVDFNRDWTDPPHHPAVRALQSAIDVAADQNDYVLYLDLHGPTPGDPSYLVPAHGAVYEARDWREHWRLGALFEAEAPKRSPLRCADWRPHALDWSFENAECVATESNRLRWGITAATLEIAYHRTADGHLVQPDGWRSTGRSLIRGIGRWLRGEAAGEPPPPPVPSLRNWLVPHLLQNVAVSESGKTLRLTPSARPNRAWAQTRDDFAGPIHLQVRHDGEQPVRLGLRGYRYAGDGRRLPGWTTQEWSASNDDERLLSPELPPGIAHRLAVVVADLPGPIELKIRPA